MSRKKVGKKYYILEVQKVGLDLSNSIEGWKNILSIEKYSFRFQEIRLNSRFRIGNWKRRWNWQLTKIKSYHIKLFMI